MSRFSIVVPVYKTEAYLDCCVESVLAQTFTDFELILVDDGSPDNCPAICDAWAAKDSRIKVVHQQNGGLSAARNSGIRCAQGDYAMFLDSDDWWTDETVLNRVASALDNTNADVLSLNYRKEYAGRLAPMYFPESVPDSTTGETAAKMIESGCWVTGACNKAIRRTLLTENGIFFREGITSEDIDWTLRLTLFVQSFAFANVCLFIYRQHGTSISNSPTLTKVSCLCGNVEECIRLLDEAGTERSGLLLPFVSYQYGTLLHNVANLAEAGGNKNLMDRVRKLAWLLDHSNNGKIRLLRYCNRFFGLSATLSLLRLRQKLLVRNSVEV